MFDRLDLALNQDLITCFDGDVGQVRQAVSTFSKNANDGHVEARSKGGMANELRDDWRSLGDRCGGVYNFRRHHGLQHRRFTLDYQVAPATQLAKLIDTTLHQQTVAATNYGLPPRQGFITTISEQRQDNQSSGRSDSRFRECFSYQYRIHRHVQHECPFLQFVLGPEAALAHMLIAFRADVRQ